MNSPLQPAASGRHAAASENDVRTDEHGTKSVSGEGGPSPESSLQTDLATSMSSEVEHNDANTFDAEEAPSSSQEQESLLRTDLIAPHAVALTDESLVSEVLKSQSDIVAKPVKRAQDPARIEVLIRGMLWAYGGARVRKFLIGWYAEQLQREYSFPGSGTFGKMLVTIREEWGVSQATIYRGIHFYRAMLPYVDDLFPVRLSQVAKDNFPTELDEDLALAERRQKADEKTRELSQARDAAVKKVNDAKNKAGNKTPAKALLLIGLHAAERKGVHKGYATLRARLGDEKASLVVYGAIMEALKKLEEEKVQHA